MDIIEEIDIDEYCDHDVKTIIDRFEKIITTSLETALEVMG
ncbi:hypothetical protein [Clostridium gasigenes]|nr:hypothetical protein [Clostridium gasigenes]